MCGIAGLLGVADRGRGEAMIVALAHRGPDGLRVETGSGFTLAHARLSIIDLEGGWQPLHAAGLEVCGNGEIYNYLELVAEQGLAPDLKTASDFEPLLHLYARDGAGALAQLRGMFALCLRSDSIPARLARDPFGIKPLYLRSSAPTGGGGGTLAFASEPRALLLGERPTLDRDAIEELLALNYTVGAKTVFAGVSRLASGATVGEDGRSVSPQPTSPFVARIRPPVAIDDEQALRRLDTVLEDSVRVHQRSDVPYGLFLSGGVDSAAIATLMARLNSRPVIAYTCGFAETDVGAGAADERRAAERVARALGLDWRETTFGEEDFWRVAPQVAWALDDPTTDFATLPTYKLAEAAKGSLKVVLTGEGGDELFGGYGRYRRALRPAWLGGRPAEPRLNAPWLEDGGAAALDRWRAEIQPSGPTDLTGLQRAQAADMATWLPNDLLLKLDRCLMAHGLEGRTPFLDREVADFALHLPDRLKVRGGRGKYLLRRWLAANCPAADAFARKQGFTVPVERWIAPRAAAIGSRLADLEGVRQVCDADAIRTLFASGRSKAPRWPLVFYGLWWSIHVARRSPSEALADLGVTG